MTQTDFYRNYRLNNALVYLPVGESSVLEPNLVDFATFIDQSPPGSTMEPPVSEPTLQAN